MFLAFLTATSASAQTVATCRNPEGYAYFHFAGILEKKDQGFIKDKISGGSVKIVKLANGKYDFVYVDIRNQPTSSLEDGAKIALMRTGATDATFIVYYFNNTIEIYTIWLDGDGQSRYDVMSSKGGSSSIHKSSVMSGECDPIDFNIIDKIAN
jgi:hypothetical protein